MLDHPRLKQALFWDQLVTVSVQREWTLNVGHRTAYERIAHLLCEMIFRLRAVGLSDGKSCDFPLTQVDLADATGLTSVHVNRTLQELRREGLIELHGRKLAVPKLEALMIAGTFIPITCTWSTRARRWMRMADLDSGRCALQEGNEFDALRGSKISSIACQPKDASPARHHLSRVHARRRRSGSHTPRPSDGDFGQPEDGWRAAPRFLPLRSVRDNNRNRTCSFLRIPPRDSVRK